jgi:hypothetical protein
MAQHIVTESEAGSKLRKDFLKETEMVSGLAIEMMETNPAMVLSPLCRKMLLEHAKNLHELWSKLENFIYVDWPKV